MDLGNLDPHIRTITEEILGYLNFSSGMPDPRLLRNLNELSQALEPQAARSPLQQGSAEQTPAWNRLGQFLKRQLSQLHGTAEAFRQVDQAESVLRFALELVPRAYLQHHVDLLFHQSDTDLFQAFFLGRVCEAVLAEGGPWDQQERIVSGALARLNDFLGHRPVAVLRTKQKIQPYAHERVRPIPIYVAGAGVASGPYQELVERALAILHQTHPGLLADAWFDPALLDELAVDPRAYDFDHPVNRRPNYHFGQWDPHHLDQQGRYRRFVLQQVTLDTMLGRATQTHELPREERLLEAAAVLAGTMLMGSGITGDRPEAHDSSVSLATLLPHIAAYRDAFYEQFLSRLEGAHARRLRDEAKRRRQPLGGARQHLNRELARRRARQLQHVHLAGIFARMGYTEAAARQADTIPVTSARMKCEIQCRLATAHLEIDGGRLEQAAAVVPHVEDLLHRAIECGALVDPWNILGFGGQFSLFPALENSVHDHRVDELIDLMSQIFGLSARLQKEAAAAGRGDLQQGLANRLGKLASWWDQFASTEVADVRGISGRESWESAGHVATALGAWHKAGTAAGDVAFWQQHVERFHSPKAYALVVEALLEQRDPVASMALLIQWLSSADEIPLAEEDYSFHRLALRWMRDLWKTGSPEPAEAAEPPADDAIRQSWLLTCKLLDYVEANAGEHWDVPQLDVAGAANHGGQPDESDEPPADDDDEHDGLFSAAYENVTYRDSTDDGFEGELIEGGPAASDFELVDEVNRINFRLAFWNTMSRLWKLAASASARSEIDPAARDETLRGWLDKVSAVDGQMTQLLRSVNRYRIPAPRGTQESLIEYERRREIKEMLLEQVIATQVETADAGRLILSTMHNPPATAVDEQQGPVLAVLREVFRGDSKAVAGAWPRLAAALDQQPLLYIPTSRGGNPARIAASQTLQRVLRRLLVYLPRMGLLDQTYELVDTIRRMEREHPVGPGAITEFDRLFDIGYQAVVRCIVASSERWQRGRKRKTPTMAADQQLVECLETATAPLLSRWLEHSRNIRLSPMESVSDQKRFQALRQFIERYGADWFTQQFMNYGNLRAILLQGVDAYLCSLEEEPEDGPHQRLLEETTDPAKRKKAVRSLEQVIEAVVEHYSEYMDYNSTTTQSDRGEMIYTLLDFLRLLATHERVAWNLKPLVTAHNVLVHCGRSGAAELWRDAVIHRTAEIADDHLKRLDRLSRKYGMRLASIADRLGERFVRPLTVDRLRALVRPAIEQTDHDKHAAVFAQLEEEADQLADEPSGVGFEVPSWLEALDDEVREIRSRDPDDENPLALDPHVPQVQLTRKQVERQLEHWEED